jgi:hypothetical protein
MSVGFGRIVLALPVLVGFCRLRLVPTDLPSGSSLDTGHYGDQ